MHQAEEPSFAKLAGNCRIAGGKSAELPQELGGERADELAEEGDDKLAEIVVEELSFHASSFFLRRSFTKL